MALTLTKVKHAIGLNNRVHIYDCTFDNAYPTAGMALTPSTVGLSTINAVDAVFSGATAANGRSVTYNPTSGKLLVWTGIATEATNSSDQSAVTARLIIHGERV